MRLYHLTTRAAWDAATLIGVYRAASLDEVGFIHLSTEAQWPTTRARWFRDAHDVVLLEIDPSRVPSPIRFDPVDSERFPHLYGPLPCAAVLAVRALAG
jgi:uncharacterized protein (DUF952 family)